MPRLAELQSLFARGLLDDPDRLPRELFAAGPIAAEVALRVHRNTVLGALANALVLTYPTVAALVGEACFDQVAAAYVAERPPTEARLAGYGGELPAFLETCPQTAGLAYLPDVARFDLAIGRAASAPLAARRIQIEPGIVLSLPVSLAVLDLLYPADLIRDAVEAGDDAALARIDLASAPRGLAVWRGDVAALARPLSRPAAVFLSALLADQPADDALAQALAQVLAQALADSPEEALAAIQSEVFAAVFATILQTSERDAQP